MLLCLRLLGDACFQQPEGSSSCGCPPLPFVPGDAGVGEAGIRIRFSDSQKKVRGKQSASQQTLNKPAFAPWKQKQGTVHVFLEMEGCECGFDKEFQTFLANLCDLSLSHV